VFQSRQQIADRETADAEAAPWSRGTRRAHRRIESQERPSLLHGAAVPSEPPDRTDHRIRAARPGPVRVTVSERQSDETVTAIRLLSAPRTC
jgi:hypothetical protein